MTRRIVPGLVELKWRGMRRLRAQLIIEQRGALERCSIDRVAEVQIFYARIFATLAWRWRDDVATIARDPVNIIILPAPRSLLRRRGDTPAVGQ